MYKVQKSFINGEFVITSYTKLDENMSIPLDEGNSEYQKVLQWLAEGNIPEDDINCYYNHKLQELEKEYVIHQNIKMVTETKGTVNLCLQGEDYNKLRNAYIDSGSGNTKVGLKNDKGIYSVRLTLTDEQATALFFSAKAISQSNWELREDVKEILSDMKDNDDIEGIQNYSFNNTFPTVQEINVAETFGIVI